MTEKKLPHHDLRRIKSVFSTVSGLIATTSAMRGASALGYEAAGIVAVIRTIKPSHFYKSMTAEHNHRAWQDVYHVPSSAGMLYIKFTDNAVSHMTLLSFTAK